MPPSPHNQGLNPQLQKWGPRSSARSVGYRVLMLSLGLQRLTGGDRRQFLSQLMTDLDTIRSDLCNVGRDLELLCKAARDVHQLILKWSDEATDTSLPPRQRQEAIEQTARSWNSLQGVLTRIGEHTLATHSITEEAQAICGKCYKLLMDENVVDVPRALKRTCRVRHLAQCITEHMPIRERSG